jgi:hypothetical protein
MVGRLSCPNIAAFSGCLGAAKANKGVFCDNLVFYATSQELCRTPPMSFENAPSPPDQILMGLFMLIRASGSLKRKPDFPF